jgi:hypothetical protein
MGLTQDEINAIGTDEEGNEAVVEEEVVEEEVPAEEEVVEEEAPEEVVEEPAPEVEEKPEKPAAFATEFKAPGVENLEQVLSDLDAAFDATTDELAKKYEAGELTFQEYRKQERGLTRDYNTRRNQLEQAQLAADIAAQHSKQSADALWQYEQKVFFADNKEFKSDAILLGALNAKLQEMYNDPANDGREGLELLREAGAAIRARFNMAPAKEPKAAEVTAIADAKAKREAKPKELPKTLASVPAADTNEDSGEFAYMDKLVGLDYEKAISKMSAEQRERFMAA